MNFWKFQPIFWLKTVLTLKLVSAIFIKFFFFHQSFSLHPLDKNSFNFKLGFFTYFEYISEGIMRKNTLHSDYHSAKWYWCKNVPKSLLQTLHKILSYLIVNSSLLWALMVQHFRKNSFSGGKSRKNGTLVIKITFALQKNPQNYRFPWINTKTIKACVCYFLSHFYFFIKW